MTSYEKLKYVLEDILLGTLAFREHIAAAGLLEEAVEQSNIQLIQIPLKLTGTISMLCRRDSRVETVEDDVSQCSNQIDRFCLIASGKSIEKAPEVLRSHQYTSVTIVCPYRRRVGYRADDCDWRMSQNPLT